MKERTENCISENGSDISQFLFMVVFEKCVTKYSNKY